MLNRDVFERDPSKFTLMNNGVAKVRDSLSEEELKTLRFELQTFICEGQYEKGLIRLLRSFNGNLGEPEQPAAWISGFFGSGKSHLVKMLRYLWVDYEFPDGATARGLANLSPPVEELLRELSTSGKRHGGLHAASGTLGSSAKGSVRLSLLSIIFKSAGLPEKYPLAQFALWLKREGLYDELRDKIENEDGKDFDKEVRNLAMSSVLARRLLDIDPTYGESVADVRQILRDTYPTVRDVSLDDMVDAIKGALSIGRSEFPCTLIALDEIQQYIGGDSQRAYDVQEVTQACTSEFGGKLQFVATGQTALKGPAELEKLTGRFRIQIELSDADVEAVTRKTVLKKKPSARGDVEDVLTRNSGEISRHLSGTDFAPKPEDDRYRVDDYPLLPTRRRFWERVLRAVDDAGTQSQLRTQLKIVDEAVKQTANDPLGTVVAGDFIYNDLRADMLRSGVLTNEVDTQIEKLRDAGREMDARLSALAFLIGKVPRDGSADTGLRGKPEMFADLLVRDLRGGSSTLRNEVEERLKVLEKEGLLMQVNGEYRMQTPESQKWMSEFQSQLRAITKQRDRTSSLRSNALRKAVSHAFGDIRKVNHGACNEPRSIIYHYRSGKPSTDDEGIPVWVRDEWRIPLPSVEADARQEGTDSPLVFVFLPKISAEELDDAIAQAKAAETTIEVQGRTSTDKGREARQAMITRKESAEARRDSLLDDIIDSARVYLAGGQEYVEGSLVNSVEEAAESAMERLFPKFETADIQGWSNVLKRALNGDGGALEAIGFSDNPEKHPVCAAVLKAVSSSTKGSEVRSQFGAAPYGWPKDAVDAALALLTETNHIRARKDGQDVEPSDLTQRTIGTTRFQAETVQIGVKQRLEIRGILDNLVNVSRGEELHAMPQYLDRVRSLAERVGGAPPLPPTPNTEYVNEVSRHSGNEKLAAFYERKDQFVEDTGRWQSMLNRKDRRLPEWKQLQRALKEASNLDGIDEIREQADAIRASRSLLDDTDPVQPLLDRITDLLRNELRSLQEAYKEEHERQSKRLNAAEPWNELSDSERERLRSKHDLDKVPEIHVGTTKQILDSLRAISLEGWKARTDALPQRFEKALSEAVKALEPDVVDARLPSRILKSTDDIEAWLDEARAELTLKLESGPVRT